MNLDSLAFFNRLPSSFEFLLHLSPDKQTFLGVLLHFIFDFSLEKEHSKGFLNFGSFFHQEFKVNVSYAGLVHTPELLNTGCCHDGSFMALEHK